MALSAQEFPSAARVVFGRGARFQEEPQALGADSAEAERRGSVRSWGPASFARAAAPRSSFLEATAALGGGGDLEPNWQIIKPRAQVADFSRSGRKPLFPASVRAASAPTSPAKRATPGGAVSFARQTGRLEADESAELVQRLQLAEAKSMLLRRDERGEAARLRHELKRRLFDSFAALRATLQRLSILLDKANALLDKDVDGADRTRLAAEQELFLSRGITRAAAPLLAAAASSDDAVERFRAVESVIESVAVQILRRSAATAAAAAATQRVKPRQAAAPAKKQQPAPPPRATPALSESEMDAALSKVRGQLDAIRELFSLDAEYGLAGGDMAKESDSDELRSLEAEFAEAAESIATLRRRRTEAAAAAPAPAAAAPSGPVREASVAERLDQVHTLLAGVVLRLVQRAQRAADSYSSASGLALRRRPVADAAQDDDPLRFRPRPAAVRFAAKPLPAMLEERDEMERRRAREAAAASAAAASAAESTEERGLERGGAFSFTRAPRFVERAPRQRAASAPSDAEQEQEPERANRIAGTPILVKQRAADDAKQQEAARRRGQLRFEKLVERLRGVTRETRSIEAAVVAAREGGDAVGPGSYDPREEVVRERVAAARIAPRRENQELRRAMRGRWRAPGPGSYDPQFGAVMKRAGTARMAERVGQPRRPLRDRPKRARSAPRPPAAADVAGPWARSHSAATAATRTPQYARVRVARLLAREQAARRAPPLSPPQAPKRARGVVQWRRPPARPASAESPRLVLLPDHGFGQATASSTVIRAPIDWAASERHATARARVAEAEEKRQEAAAARSEGEEARVSAAAASGSSGLMARQSGREPRATESEEGADAAAGAKLESDDDEELPPIRRAPAPDLARTTGREEEAEPPESRREGDVFLLDPSVAATRRRAPAYSIAPEKRHQSRMADEAQRSRAESEAEAATQWSSPRRRNGAAEWATAVGREDAAEAEEADPKLAALHRRLDLEPNDALTRRARRSTAFWSGPPRFADKAPEGPEGLLAPSDAYTAPNPRSAVFGTHEDYVRDEPTLPYASRESAVDVGASVVAMRPHIAGVDIGRSSGRHSRREAAEGADMQPRAQRSEARDSSKTLSDRLQRATRAVASVSDLIRIKRGGAESAFEGVAVLDREQ